MVSVKKKLFSTNGKVTKSRQYTVTWKNLVVGFVGFKNWEMQFYDYIAAALADLSDSRSTSPAEKTHMEACKIYRCSLGRILPLFLAHGHDPSILVQKLNSQSPRLMCNKKARLHPAST